MPHILPVAAVPPATPIAFMVGGILFAAALVRQRLSIPRGKEAGAKRSPGSLIGIALQGLGFALVTGPTRMPLSLDGWAAPRTIAVALCALGAAALFQWAARTMGRNWSLVARVREDHQLVTDGPFRWVRHPIYAAMALLLVGWALTGGRETYLLIALPIFLIGTLIRTTQEEALLQRQFGAHYDDYAARVKRFVPGVI